MKVYPKGTVCIIKDTKKEFARFKGRDCTIVQEERVWPDGKRMYEIEIQGENKTYRTNHPSLKPKKFPPDAAFDSFFNKLLQPCDIDSKENVR